MLKTLILGGTAIATIVTPAVADAQYYNYNYNSEYSYYHHHHRNDAGAVIAAGVVGGILGYAVGSSRGYGYRYPSYGYNNYGYQPGYNYDYQPGYNYGYPGNWYDNSYAYPSYGYGGHRHDYDDDDGD